MEMGKQAEMRAGIEDGDRNVPAPNAKGPGLGSGAGPRKEWFRWRWVPFPQETLLDTT